MLLRGDAVIRSARPGDAESICRIYNSALAERQYTFETEPRSDRSFEDRIRDSRFPLLVVTGEGKIAGWAGLAPYSSRPCYAGIGECSVYVALETRGRGLGTALTRALAEAAHDAGFHKVIGKLLPDTAASIHLVERCGFRPVGLHHRHGRLDSEWRDVLVVERLLG
jgi:L-amino acid N-acyltransferase YncA